MTVLYDGELEVSYSFIHVGPPEVEVTMERGGQVNGLVAAAQPGVLSLVTGMHTGPVPLVVEVLDAAPPLEERWEDAVEVSFTTSTVDLWLQAFQDAEPIALPSPGTYRVRYCAVGMDRAHQADVRSSGEPEVDRYLLQLWPAPAAPDEVVRLGSETAASWHAAARATPPPPPPPTMDELTALARAEDAERDRLAREAERQRELWTWGGRVPSPRLRELSPSVAQLARADRDLVDAVVALPAPRQRVLAAWAARRSAHLAGLAEVPWVAAALVALDRVALPLPAPFHDAQAALDRLLGGGPITLVATVSHAGPAPEPPPLDPGVAMVFTVVAAGHPDPAEAALSSLDRASHAEADRSSFFGTVRRLLDGRAG